MKIKIDDEMVDKLVIASLKDAYKSMSMDIKQMQAKKKLPKYLAEDLAYNLDMVTHIRAVLSFYGVTV